MLNWLFFSPFYKIKSANGWWPGVSKNTINDIFCSILDWKPWYICWLLGILGIPIPQIWLDTLILRKNVVSEVSFYQKWKYDMYHIAKILIQTIYLDAIWNNMESIYAQWNMCFKNAHGENQSGLKSGIWADNVMLSYITITCKDSSINKCMGGVSLKILLDHDTGIF